MRGSIIILPVLAIALTLPALAQRVGAVDQQTRQQVEALVEKYIDALNRGDGHALAAMYGQHPISIVPYGKRTSAAEIEADVESVHKRGLALTAKVDDVEPLFGGQGMVATAPYQAVFSDDPGAPHVQGNLMLVLEKAGGSWKIGVSSASRLVPAPAR